MAPPEGTRTMLAHLARFTARRHRAVLLVALVAVIAAGAFGGGVASQLTSGGFDDPDAESSRAADWLEATFGATEANLVLVVTAAQGTVDDPGVVAEATALVARLEAEPDVDQVASYWTLGNAAPLRSSDATMALVLGHITGDEDATDATAAQLIDTYAAESGPLRVAVGGLAAVFNEVGETIESDLARAEAITLPITLVLLVLIFGSVVAAGLPLLIGIVSVVGTMAVLTVVNSLTDVSVYALNLTTAMGLGLAIDYALFIVSRYREELHHGWGTADALARSLETAGRTVVFSAATVAVSLAALLVFPLDFLRSFAWAGMAVVALAAAGTLVVLPAALAALGPRVERWSLRRRGRAPTPVEEGFWHRVATVVMRHPWRSAGAVVALLVVLGLPFGGVRFGLSDDRVLPEGADARAAQDSIRAGFSSQEAGALDVALPGLDPAAGRDALDAYAAALSSLDGVARVDAATGSYAGGRKVLDAADAPAALTTRFVAPGDTWVSVVPSIEPRSTAGERLVHDIRELPAPVESLVTGQSAQLVDAKDALFSRLPLALAIIAMVTFVVMFLMVGSVVVPAKALLLNLLSLSATFGAMVWVFQDGHLAGLLGFTATGTLEVTMPILMFCIAFGLSMDYEVFLLSRIKEEYDRTGDNERAVAVGLERTGRIVSAAALLLSVVFVAFGTSQISFMKMFGVGLALAVLMDATLVRGVLVPAFMRLAGKANWWAPRPLARLHTRLGLAERELDGSPPEPCALGAATVEG